MKEYYPLHYARLQKYIDEGRWHISGASWNANDPNMPSAESFIRNILQGQELYKREFGVRSTDIFLPDCFGFGYTLPSLAAHCGLIGFSTQKLSWRKHDFFPDAPYHKKNPFSWGVWYGIDGQSLMAAFDTAGIPPNCRPTRGITRISSAALRTASTIRPCAITRRPPARHDQLRRQGQQRHGDHRAPAWPRPWPTPMRRCNSSAPRATSSSSIIWIAATSCRPTTANCSWTYMPAAATPRRER